MIEFHLCKAFCYALTVTLVASLLALYQRLTIRTTFVNDSYGLGSTLTGACYYCL